MIRVGYPSLMTIGLGHLYPVHNPIAITLYKEGHDPLISIYQFPFYFPAIAPPAPAPLLSIVFSDFRCSSALALQRSMSERSGQLLWAHKLLDNSLLTNYMLNMHKGNCKCISQRSCSGPHL